jgi:hypothetical protein
MARARLSANHRLRPRLERALRELPLSDKDIARVASELLRSNVLLATPGISPDSGFFDFHGKASTVVDHFACAA